MCMMPLHLHVNKKSDYDDDDNKLAKQNLCCGHPRRAVTKFVKTRLTKGHIYDSLSGFSLTSINLCCADIANHIKNSLHIAKYIGPNIGAQG